MKIHGSQFKNYRNLLVQLGALLAFNFHGFSQQFTELTVGAFSDMEVNYGNAVADYDLDGDLDIFIVAYNSFNSADPTTWSRLLNNKGSRFEDATVEAGLASQHSRVDAQDVKLGASWGDYDNDGYPDLLLAHQNGTELYRNQGDGTFKDVTTVANIVPCEGCNNSNALWWDYDLDGDLDLYLSYLDYPNRLYKNTGNGSFEEVLGALGLDDPSVTWSCLPIDANHDGWMDLYVVNDFGLGKFYVNQQGTSFVESTEEYNLRNIGCGMGSDIGDYNNDSYFDIYVTNIADFIANPLFSGSAEGPFQDKAAEEQVENGHFGWGTRFLDADNDGDQDLYVVNGNLDEHYNNVFFKNMLEEEGSGFVNWSSESKTDGGANGMGAEVFDYDNDGDLDILVSNTNDSPYLYRNDRGNGNSWIQVNLEGTVSNRNAFGTQITAYCEGTDRKRLHHGAAIMGQSLKPVHFGLGQVKKVDSLLVSWPNGMQETIYDIAINQKIKLVEGQGMQEGKTYVPEEEEETPQPTQPISNEPNLVFYPNPVTEYVEFNLEADTSTSVDLKIYSLQGVLVFSQKEQHTEATNWKGYWYGKDNIGMELPSGIYAYRITTDLKVWTGKLILSH